MHPKMPLGQSVLEHPLHSTDSVQKEALGGATRWAVAQESLWGQRRVPTRWGAPEKGEDSEKGRT